MEGERQGERRGGGVLFIEGEKGRERERGRERKRERGRERERESEIECVRSAKREKGK